jgi:hypothetical protein
MVRTRVLSLSYFGVAIALTSAALVLTACGSDSSTGAAPTTSTPTVTTSSAPTTTTPAEAAQSSAAPASSADSTGPADTTLPGLGDSTGCEDATVEVNKAINALPEGDFVADIEIEGKCTVSVRTGYTQDKAAAALKVCQAAESPAYANGAVGVLVRGAGNVEFAAGTKSSPCALKI